MPQVQVIQPIQQQPKRLRVAAYARVSSDSEDQLNSLAVQVDYYTHLIQENPNWEFAGIYTDEGITGTSTKRREQFNRLMDDCRAGLIDRVLVKSASRFARNTADALSSVRELKSLGVTVAFEKEGFDTETSNGEMLLSIICAVAQEESLSISQNMKWGIHKRMRTGNYITNATPFGYTQINHQLVPEKNNAMIVNDIFKSYLSGMSINEIAEHLNTIYPKENSKWNPRTIHAILRNEKYIGDSLYQKTYTTDSLPLKRYLNTGQRSKYYAMETHEGIISKTDYEKVQNLLAKKSITGEIDRTCVFSKKIYCSICGAICSRKGPPTQGFVWCCRTHLQSKALCLLKSIREDELQQAFLSIYNRLQCNQKTILEPLVDDLLGLRHLQEQKYKKRLALGEDIQHLAKQKHNLTRIHTLGYIEEPQFIERSAAIEQQIRERKQQLSRNDMSNTSEKILQKTRLIQKKLSSTPPLELFDESVFKELVKKVLISNTAIQFELINGIHGRKQIVWRCVNRLEYGTKFCSHSPSIPEEELHQAILKAVQNLAANFTDEVAAQLDGILRQMKAGENLKAQLQKQLEKAQQEFDRLLEMSLELDESTPFLDDKLRKLSGKIKILKANIAESTDGKGEDEEATKQLTAQDLLIKEYDDILTARIIEKVIVHSRQEIEIYFIGGYTQKIDLI